jgi:hypothetical protein
MISVACKLNKIESVNIFSIAHNNFQNYLHKPAPTDPKLMLMILTIWNVAVDLLQQNICGNAQMMMDSPNHL